MIERATIGAAKPEAATLERWAREEMWRPEHGVMLAFGQNPETHVTQVEGGASLVPPQSLLTKARDAVETGLIEAECRPAIVIAWARGERVEFHPDWTERLFGDHQSAEREIGAAARKLKLRTEYIKQRNRLIRDWARAPYWSLADGIALVHNLDPEEVIEASIRGFLRIKGHPGADRFLRHAVTAHDHGDINQSMRPAEFLRWAPSIGMKIDPAWTAATAASSQSDASGESKPAPDRAAPLIPAEVLPGRGQSDTSLKTKERESLLKLFIGMAVEQYGYDPSRAKNPATKRIQDDLALSGLSIDEDTIRRYLKLGAELLPGSAADD